MSATESLHISYTRAALEEIATAAERGLDIENRQAHATIAQVYATLAVAAATQQMADRLEGWNSNHNALRVLT